MVGQSNRISYPSLRWSAVLVLLISIVCDGLVSRNSSAQDPITPSGLNTHVDLASNPPIGKTQYDITGGTRPGGVNGTNLFHSFGDFGVPPNNIANFLNETALPTDNILARVTGTNGSIPTLSSIYGTIQTTGFGNANLFLMNPAGFLFGPNATLNVGGTVAFTSADYLKLADDARFNAIPDAAADALLTALPVASFGFLGSNPGAITIKGSQFAVTEGTGISLVGGNITIQAVTLKNETVQPAKLSAPSGQINLASVSSPGEIAVDTLTPGPNIDGIPPSSFGNISLSQNTQLNTTGSSGGTIRIRGGQLTMDSAFMFADSTVGTPDPSTAIAVNIEGNIKLTNGSSILARGSGQDRGGNIELVAKNISLLDGSAIRAEGRGAGQVGDILITATDNVVISGVDAFDNPSRIETFTLGSGDSGSIKVIASQVTLADMGLIQTRVGGQKPAGDITLSVDRLDISGGGAVYTEGGHLTPSGSIHIVATDTISLSGIGQLDGLPSRIENENTSGDTGTINIVTNNLHISDHGRINSVTGLAATEPLEPKISITVHHAMTLSEESRIDVAAFQSDVGALAIQSGSLSLSGMSVINTETSGAGASSPINIATGTLSVTGGSQIISASTQGSGNAGNITVTAKNVSLNGGHISTNTTGEGPGGNIDVTAGQSVTLTNGASISASSTGPGNAGNISINAGNRFEARNSSVTTKSEQAGGGNIEINALDQIRLVNSQVNASAFLDGGNISIDPNVVTLQNSQILAQAIQGAGGNITIFTPLFVADSTSLVSASSQFGLNGTVTIQSPTSNLSESLGALPSEPSQAQTLLTQRCAALANGQTSSFVVAGREQLPSDPGGWLSGPIALVGIDAERIGEGTVAEGTSHLEPRTSGLLANDRVSLRRLTPAGFLMANFADSEATGCRS